MNLLRTALGLCLLLPSMAPAAEDVRVYRCVASNGAVALQDTPCNSGRQEVRDLQRPRDPAPRVVRSDASPAPPDEAPVMRDREVRHVYIQPPQPLYECVRDDGQRYTSDSNEGNPRWVPLWTSVWLPHGHRGPAYPGPRPAIGTPIGEGAGYRPPSIGMGCRSRPAACWCATVATRCRRRRSAHACATAAGNWIVATTAHCRASAPPSATSSVASTRACHATASAERSPASQPVRCRHEQTDLAGPGVVARHGTGRSRRGVPLHVQQQRHTDPATYALPVRNQAAGAARARGLRPRG